MVSTVGLRENLGTVFAKTFEKARFEPHEIPLSEKLGGFLVWEGFAGRGHQERQKLLWDCLRAALSVEDQMHISAIFTVTEAELSSMRESE